MNRSAQWWAWSTTDTIRTVLSGRCGATAAERGRGSAAQLILATGRSIGHGRHIGTEVNHHAFKVI